MSGRKDYFTEKVRGEVRAAFILDEKGAPQYIDIDGRHHYKVELSLQTQNPEVRLVVYKLHPSYYDTIRESTDASDNFAVRITTYGDYQFVVDVTVGSGGARQSFQLYKLLRATHGGDSNPQVVKALADIKSN